MTVADLQSKEQMLKKLYEHLYSKSLAIIKAKNAVSNDYVAA